MAEPNVVNLNLVTPSGGPITPETDPKILFDLLESSNGAVVQELKDIIQEIIYSVRDPWVVNGLFDYYMGTGSERCMDILLGISKEPHDKYLIEKILECIRNVPTRRAGMTFLGHLVNRKPSWLYKIAQAQHNLLKEILRILKTDTDIVILMSGLLIITTLIPIIPVPMTAEHLEIFGIFEKLATWAHTSTNVPEEHLLHLQVGLYSLFHRLYALYPCNFFSFLRQKFSSSDKRVPMEVFENTIKPMLETVKLHPKLITGSRENEILPSRWRNREPHDIIAECSLISLDVLESGVPEEVNPIQLATTPASRTRPGLIIPPPDQHFPVSQLIQNSVKDLTDLSQVTNEDSSAPPTPLSTMSTTTPSTGTKSVVSPPETAMEATPENTPIATPVKDRHTSHFKLPAPNSPAVMHLAFGKPPQTPPITPFSSVPSSPAPHTADKEKETAAYGTGIGLLGTSLYRRDSIFDTNTMNAGGMGRRESLFAQKLQKLVDEQRLKEKDKEETINVLAPAPGLPTIQKKPFTLEQSHPHGMGFDIDSGLLQPPIITTSDQENDDSLEENDEVKGDPVPMPDKKSMIAFAQRVRRLRFYSQCGEQSIAGSVSPGSSPSSSFLTSSHNRVKRSTSCPDVLKKVTTVITEESVPEATTSEEGTTTTSTAPVETDSQTTLVESESQEPLQPYEHLFEGVLPYFMQHPGESTTQIQSPHSILDLCIQKAAACHESKGGDELTMLRNQVGLLHAQLLFERHRREAHALRNRSLAKQCRTAQQQEDKNYGLSSQLHSLEKEVSMLRAEVNLQRSKSIEKEKELQAIILDLESKLKVLKLELEVTAEFKTSLEAKHSEQIVEIQKLNKEIEQKNSYIFQLESDLAHTSRFVDTNSQIKAAYENLQKEFLLLGELYRKQQERLNSYDNNRYVLDEMEDLRLTYENELKNLKNIADLKTSAADVAVGFIHDLEQQLVKKDAVIHDQKRLVQEAGIEYTAQIKVLEEKYDCIKQINSRLELEILNLQHQLAMKATAASRSNIVHRRISPSNGESPHNSNNSDVDSAASAGGFQLSPEQFIFGSPQFGPPSVEMNDLQRVIEGEERATSSATRLVPGIGRSVSHPQGSVPRTNTNNPNWQ